MRLASHLRMSLSQCRREISSQEYVLWMARLDEEWNETTKIDYYLAQIAAMIEAANSKNPAEITIKGRLLKFKEDDGKDKVVRSKRPKNLLTSEERQEALNALKESFKGHFRGARGRGRGENNKDTMRGSQ